jgi:1-phosphofructokinase family hexose kinase
MLLAVPGGKALNVARAARTLGLDAAVIAVLGGHAGDWMEEQLAARGIRTRAVRVPGETRTCVSVLDRETGALTEFYEAGLEMDGHSWAVVEEALRLELAEAPGHAAGALVIMSGSVPPGAPLDGYGRLTRLAADLGARAAVDVGGRHLEAALAARPWLVKVNLREAAEAVGSIGSDVDGALTAARELRRRGAAAALVTAGPQGAALADPDGGEWVVDPAPEMGPYAVGSGDAMLAGLAAALSRGLALPEAARAGAAAACASALRPGQGELDPKDVDRLLPAISVTRRYSER